MAAYYNEIDSFAANWLRELIKAGHIADGEVDERSIEDVFPGDLRGFRQCHFFAGIGVWSYALRRAGWPDDRPVWTGSCPCQPFSDAGKREGAVDKRHLWPSWFHLIEQCRPPVIFGEQVESAIRHGWLDLVQTDMEGIDYAFGPVPLPAAGFGAPHIRQRLWFVAENLRSRPLYMANPEHYGSHTSRGLASLTNSDKPHEWLSQRDRDSGGNLADAGEHGRQGGLLRGTDQDWGRGTLEHGQAGCDSTTSSGIVGHASGGRCEQRDEGQRAVSVSDSTSSTGSVGYTEHLRCDTPISGDGRGQAGEGCQSGDVAPGSSGPGYTNGFWRDCEWIWCKDGKYRPVESGTFPLAHGVTSRVGRLRGYGNALCAEAAIHFIESYLDVEASRFRQPVH